MLNIGGWVYKANTTYRSTNANDIKYMNDLTPFPYIMLQLLHNFTSTGSTLSSYM